MKRYRSPQILAATVLVLSLGAWAVDAFELRKVERVHLDDMHPGAGGERVVDLYLRVLTKHGEPVEQLRAVDLDIREDTRRIDPDDVSVSALGDTTRGVTCVLVIDVSPTMRGDAFDDAKAAALNFLDLLGRYDEVAIVSFAGAAELVAPFSSSRADARFRLGELQINPNPAPTVLYDAVHQALDLVREGVGMPRRSFVIVFSDGKDGGSSHTLDQVIGFGQGNETQARILVYTIGYTRFGGVGLEGLRRLSEETGGGFFEARTTRTIKSFYSSIWLQMDRSYVVTFPSHMDGREHTVKVVIEETEDSRAAAYPMIRWPLWHYFAPATLGLLLAITVLLILRRRSPGRLAFVVGPRAGETIPLKRGTTRIGALLENDVVIDSMNVSRNHAEIHTIGRGLEIQDLHSTNGTYVNGAPVQTSPLNPGDKIRIADVDLIFER